MIYGSVCSGIEAATVAWHPLGWTLAWFAEIDPFARAVLAYRLPEVRNLGDFTSIRGHWLRRIGATRIDLLVGGTPCQSFSLAGRRLGLDDPRGNLTLEFLRLAKRLRPRWIVWENVPGVLSIDGGRTFGTVLGTLAELGYGVAYRILDAQFFGVPQRRRRIFVVGHLGRWQVAAAVLFERESLCRNLAPRRKAGQEIAGTLEARASTGGFDPGAHGAATGHLIVSQAVNAKWAKGTSGPSGDEWHNLIPAITHTLRGEGMDASEDGTGRGVPILPVAFSCKDYGADAAGDVAPTLRAMGHLGSHPNAGGQLAVAFTERGRTQGRTLEFQEDVAYCLTNPGSGGQRTAVRSLHQKWLSGGLLRASASGCRAFPTTGRWYPTTARKSAPTRSKSWLRIWACRSRKRGAWVRRLMVLAIRRSATRWRSRSCAGLVSESTMWITCYRGRCDLRARSIATVPRAAG